MSTQTKSTQHVQYVTIPPIHRDDPGQCILLEEGQTVTVFQRKDRSERITHQRVTINPAPGTNPTA